MTVTSNLKRDDYFVIKLKETMVNGEIINCTGIGLIGKLQRLEAEYKCDIGMLTLLHFH